MVQAQGVYTSSGQSAQVTVAGEQDFPLPLIMGLALVGIVIAAIILKK
ncbi:hypothetical protein LCGC14_2920610 [marine sediment metagenome]|uniref:Uncharacterized protein n=1 Tax=marine sediment metagenome TaxID=412755 RepID=A0A0F8ZWG5_9ZZZZ